MSCRVPIIVTGNDLSKIFAPLVRDGRMAKFYWQPSRTDLIAILHQMYRVSTLIFTTACHCCFGHCRSACQISASLQPFTAHGDSHKHSYLLTAPQPQSTCQLASTAHISARVQLALYTAQALQAAAWAADLYTAQALPVHRMTGSARMTWARSLTSLAASRLTSLALCGEHLPCTRAAVSA